MTRLGEFIDYWTDDDRQPRRDRLQERGWTCALIPEGLDDEEETWLLDALQQYGAERFTGYCFDFKNKGTRKNLISREDIVEFMRTSKFVMIVDEKESFLFYQHEFHDFCMMCGDENFIGMAYRRDEKEAYFDYVEYYLDDAEGARLKSVWHKYKR